MEGREHDGGKGVGLGKGVGWRVGSRKEGRK